MKWSEASLCAFANTPGNAVSAASRGLTKFLFCSIHFGGDLIAEFGQLRCHAGSLAGLNAVWRRFVSRSLPLVLPVCKAGEIAHGITGFRFFIRIASFAALRVLCWG
jgi:hypothetical protein